MEIEWWFPYFTSRQIALFAEQNGSRWTENDYSLNIVRIHIDKMQYLLN